MSYQENIILLELAYGRMSLKAHQIERGLVLIMASSIGKSKQEQDDLLSKYKRLTLGRLIQLAKDKQIFDSELLSYLDKVLKVRNEFVHDISGIIGCSIMSSGKAIEVIEYITSFTVFLKDVSQIIQMELVKSAPDMDFNVVNDIANKAVKEWHT